MSTSSYLITGASRGLGFEFVRQLAQDPKNTVIGLVRNKAAAEAKAKEQGLHNVHMVEAQYTDLASLKKAAEVVKGITNGGLDYLVNNAAIVSHISEWKTLGDFDDDFETMERDIRESLEINLLGAIKIIHAFLPLVRNGREKKLITISTGMADIDLINATEVAFGSPYAISKGAINIAMAKYNALYNKDGILFLAVSPGYVSTERNIAEAAPADADKAAVLVGKFAEYAPHFQRPLTPQESIKAVLAVMHKASIANGDGGAFISHLGNKQWL
ncbi:uncharacterized protein N7484_002539 [Penicillium longicatenatum]|uniref:uncharacterized protein n=1 Tax=Penicillium longicatenatum TaxID=1561947 RepID=UPI002548BF70|nr:uncharacterized protein N7484_002539 [Penicillium longicatenatum]KAJ5648816.1 hypothetical protein N7484_002539 [Penicillium longicatenatum]